MYPKDKGNSMVDDFFHDHPSLSSVSNFVTKHVEPYKFMDGPLKSIPRLSLSGRADFLKNRGLRNVDAMTLKWSGKKWKENPPSFINDYLLRKVLVDDHVRNKKPLKNQTLVSTFATCNFNISDNFFNEILDSAHAKFLMDVTSDCLSPRKLDALKKKADSMNSSLLNKKMEKLDTEFSVEKTCRRKGEVGVCGCPRGTLNIDGYDMTMIPPCMKKFKWMKTIYFGNGDISKIENLDALERLNSLNLQGNKIRKIENLDKLKQLKYLFLSNNNISKIEGLKNVKFLERLMLNRNHIRKLENVNHLEYLESLNASQNEIRDIDDLSNLKILQRLHLGRNMLGPLVDTSKMGTPDDLDLTDNQIEKITITDNILKNVSYFRLIDNNLKNFDSFKEQFDKLEEINLSRNKIESLNGVNALFQPSSISQIYLGMNDIKDIPDDLVVPKFTTLFLSGNPIPNEVKERFGWDSNRPWVTVKGFSFR